MSDQSTPGILTLSSEEKQAIVNNRARLMSAIEDLQAMLEVDPSVADTLTQAESALRKVNVMYNILLRQDATMAERKPSIP